MAAPAPQYRIVIKEELGPAYARAFDGMRIEMVDGKTSIVGPIADQAQLHGILARLSSLNLVLLSINVIDTADTEPPP
jgi:hypothetical protein